MEKPLAARAAPLRIKKRCHINQLVSIQKQEFLLKVKEGENFNHPDVIGTGIHTLSILRTKICSLTQRLGKKAIYGWTPVKSITADQPIH